MKGKGRNSKGGMGRGSKSPQPETSDEQGNQRPGSGQDKRNSNQWINSQIIQASNSANFFQGILAVLETYLPEMNLVNLSTAIHRLAKLTSSSNSNFNLRQSRIIGALVDEIAQAFAKEGQDPSLPQPLSNISWSLATLRIYNRRVLELVSSLAVLNMKDFKAFELAALLWSFAKLGVADNMPHVVEPLFRSATNRLMVCAAGAGFRSLSTATWAFATARQASQRLFKVISKEVQACIRTANSQELANIVWAFGTVNLRDGVLFTAIAEESIPRLEEFKPQELSNIFWGFASNDFYHEAFFAKALLLSQCQQLQPQHMANILWAAARLQRKHPAAKSAALKLIPACLSALMLFKPQELASTAQALAKIFCPEAELGVSPHLAPPELMLQYSLPRPVWMFFATIGPWCKDRIESFSDQSLANITASFGMLALNFSEDFLQVLQDQIMIRLPQLEHPILVSLFRASVQSPQLSRIQGSIAARVAREIEMFKAKELRCLALARSMKLGILMDENEIDQELLKRWCLDLLNGQDGQDLLPPPVQHPKMIPDPKPLHQQVDQSTLLQGQTQQLQQLQQFQQLQQLQQQGLLQPLQLQQPQIQTQTPMYQEIQQLLQQQVQGQSQPNTPSWSAQGPSMARPCNQQLHQPSNVASMLRPPGLLGAPSNPYQPDTYPVQLPQNEPQQLVPEVWSTDNMIQRPGGDQVSPLLEQQQLQLRMQQQLDQIRQFHEQVQREHEGRERRLREREQQLQAERYELEQQRLQQEQRERQLPRQRVKSSDWAPAQEQQGSVEDLLLQQLRKGMLTHQAQTVTRSKSAGPLPSRHAKSLGPSVSKLGMPMHVSSDSVRRFGTGSIPLFRAAKEYGGRSQPLENCAVQSIPEEFEDFADPFHNPRRNVRFKDDLIRRQKLFSEVPDFAFGDPNSDHSGSEDGLFSDAELRAAGNDGTGSADFSWPIGVPRVETGEMWSAAVRRETGSRQQEGGTESTDFHWPTGVPRVDTGEMWSAAASAFQHDGFGATYGNGYAKVPPPPLIMAPRSRTSE